MSNEQEQGLIVSTFEDFIKDASMLLMNVDNISDSTEFTTLLEVVDKLRPFIENISNLNIQVFDVILKAVEKISEIKRLSTGHSPIPKEKLKEVVPILLEVKNILSIIDQNTVSTMNSDDLKLNAQSNHESSDKSEKPNVLYGYQEAFSPKEKEDYKPRYNEIKVQLELKIKSAGTYSEKAINELLLIATIFQDLEYMSDNEDKANVETFIGTLVLLEKALNIRNVIYRNSQPDISRGFAKDIFSQLDTLENEKINRLNQRWQTIIKTIATEAERSKQAKKTESGQSYSDERRMMMKEIINRFGNLDLNDNQAEAILGLLENVLNVQTTGNLRLI